MPQVQIGKIIAIGGAAFQIVGVCRGKGQAIRSCRADKGMGLRWTVIEGQFVLVRKTPQGDVPDWMLK
jgi:hypothetical protein